MKRIYYRSNDEDEGLLGALVALRINLTPDNKAAQAAPLAHLEDLIPPQERPDLVQTFRGQGSCYEITLQ